MNDFENKCLKLGFRNGAKVQVMYAPDEGEIAGWENFTDDEMVHEVGKIFTINVVDEGGVSGEDSDYFWPWWCLKLVAPSENPEPKIIAEYGPYTVGDTVYVGDDKGTILGFNHEDNLIHVDLGDEDTYWFNYYDVADSKPSVVVGLNDEYIASLDFDSATVTVGCQEIPFSKVTELYNAIQSGK